MVHCGKISFSSCKSPIMLSCVLRSWPPKGLGFQPKPPPCTGHLLPSNKPDLSTGSMCDSSEYLPPGQPQSANGRKEQQHLGCKSHFISCPLCGADWVQIGLPFQGGTKSAHCGSWENQEQGHPEQQVAPPQQSRPQLRESGKRHLVGGRSSWKASLSWEAPGEATSSTRWGLAPALLS